MNSRISMVVLVPALIVLAGYRQVKSQNQSTSNGFDLVDKTGNIRKPADFRDLYQVLGVYTPVDLNGDTEMHYTYAPLSITGGLESLLMAPCWLKRCLERITPN